MKQANKFKKTTTPETPYHAHCKIVHAQSARHSQWDPKCNACLAINGPASVPSGGPAGMGRLLEAKALAGTRASNKKPFRREVITVMCARERVK